jgi:hypothetical protein
MLPSHSPRQHCSSNKQTTTPTRTTGHTALAEFLESSENVNALNELRDMPSELLLKQQLQMALSRV